MAGFEFDDDLLDFIVHTREEEVESFNIEDFKEFSIKAKFPSPKELEKITKKGEMYLGALFDDEGEFIDHATISMKDLTVHQITYAVSGAGKTEKMKFFLCCLLLQKDIAKRLRLEQIEKDLKVFDAIVIDNLGNFRNFGEPLLQDKKEFLRIYLEAGWKPDYLRSLGKTWVRKYKPNCLARLSLWKSSRIIPNLKSAQHFLNYLEFLGVNVMGVIGIIYKTLSKMGFFSETYNKKTFRFDEFYKILKKERDDLIKFAKTFEGRADLNDEGLEEVRKKWEQIATLDKIISPLEVLDKEYKGVFEPPEFEDNKIVIQDCSETSDRWLFHSTILDYYYSNFAKKPENLQSIKLMVCTDEYNDILDDKDLVNSKDYEEKREGYLSNWTRSFFLRLVREGRNYGSPVNPATQNPSQLLVKEGKKFSSIYNIWIGYLGRELNKLDKNKSLESNFGNQEVILEETEEGGWISKKGSGRWVLISGGQIMRIQTFLSFYS